MKTASRLAIVGWLVLAILGRAEAAEYRDSGTTVAAGCPPLRATAVPGNGLLLTQVPVGDPQSEGHPAHVARHRAAKMPSMAHATMFDTAEADAILSALQVFPPDNPWNQAVNKWPVHPNSRTMIASVGGNKPLRCNADMGFVLVPPDQKRVEVTLTTYASESDPGPYPVPDNLPIEGWPARYLRDGESQEKTLDDVQRDRFRRGGDRHAIVVDPVDRMLYEFYAMRKTGFGWEAAGAAIFDLKTNRLRPDGWTSTDAAGLPIFPAVVRYDEIRRGMVEHAMRVTIRKSRRAYVAPATHYASSLVDKNLPRMGERFRLKKDFDVSGFPHAAQAILKGLKKYGMFVADNGIEWAISVAPDERIPVLDEALRRVKGSDFEVVQPPSRKELTDCASIQDAGVQIDTHAVAKREVMSDFVAHGTRPVWLGRGPFETLRSSRSCWRSMEHSIGSHSVTKFHVGPSLS